MPNFNALWFPYWYQLDQSLVVSETPCELDFFYTPPSYVAADKLEVFYHGNWNEKELFYTKTVRINHIHHNILGDFRRLDTENLFYTLELLNGEELQVEAEEIPGQLYGDHSETVITDWRFYVELETV